MAELRISRSAFLNNLKYLKQIIKPEVALVLKDNAYGHGISVLAPLAARAGIKSVFVRNWSEAIKASPYFTWVTVLYPDFGNLPYLPENIVPVVNTLDDFCHLFPSQRVELNVSTNTNRNGILMRDLTAAMTIAKGKKVTIMRVFTHNGYEPNSPGFKRGLSLFEAIKRKTKEVSITLQTPLPQFHSLASLGALSLPNYNDDLVRIGLAAYGYLETTQEMEVAQNLTPIISLWARKIVCKKLEKGSLIGYHGVTQLPNTGYVSSYNVGYGDGFPFLKRGDFVLPRGMKMFPKNSMDCFSTWGKLSHLCVWNDAAYVAKFFGWSVYEVLVRLNSEIDRILVN